MNDFPMRVFYWRRLITIVVITFDVFLGPSVGRNYYFIYLFICWHKLKSITIVSNDNISHRYSYKSRDLHEWGWVRHIESLVYLNK